MNEWCVVMNFNYLKLFLNVRSFFFLYFKWFGFLNVFFVMSLFYEFYFMVEKFEGEWSKVVDIII